MTRKPGIIIKGTWLRAAREYLGVENYHPSDASAPPKEDGSGERQEGAWGVSYGHLHRIEKEKKGVSDATLAKIIYAMRKRAEFLDAQPAAAKRTISFQKYLKDLLDKVVSEQDDTLRLNRFVIDSIDSPLPATAALTEGRVLGPKALEAMHSPLNAKQPQKPSRIRNAKLRGDELLRNYRFDEAIQPCLEAVRRKQYDWDARINLIAAFLCSRKGNPLKMWRAAQMQVVRDPAEPPPEYWTRWQTWHGILWYRHPHLDEEVKFRQAEKLFRDAMQNAKGTSWAIPANHLAVVLFRSGEAEKQVEAKALFKKTLRVNQYLQQPKQDEARSLFEKTLRIWKRKTHPYEWARAQKRLANYWLLIKEENHEKRSGNLRKAAAHYEAALEVYGKESFPVEWAQVRYTWADLDMALAELDENNAESHFEAATQTCLKALTQLSIKNGEDWGRATFNLAESYRRRPNPTERRLKNAIKAYLNTLRVYTRKFIPTEWSQTHFPLSQAYQHLAEMRGCDCQLLALAIASAKAARSIRNDPNLATYEEHLQKLRKRYSGCRCNKKISYSDIAPAK